MVERIVNILMLAQSIYVQQFIMLREDVQMEIIKARSNIEYLTLLKEPCEKLKQCITPDELIPILSKIIHLCRTIWLNSPYYNTTEKMTNLFIALSNEIIIICQNLIDLRQVFQGKTRASIQMFSDCIRICEEYKKHYIKVNIYKFFSLRIIMHVRLNDIKDLREKSHSSDSIYFYKYR